MCPMVIEADLYQVRVRESIILIKSKSESTKTRDGLHCQSTVA